MRQITTAQYADENGNPFARDAACLNKCWWVENKAEIVSMCPFYVLKQCGEKMVEHCTDPCEW
jgi:hypothetical protein